MKPVCPWCLVSLKRGFIRDLTSVGSPCPHCEKPIKQSVGHVVSTVLMLLPLIALVLYASKMLHDAGTPFGAIFLLFLGMILGTYLQRFLPVVFGPSKAPFLKRR